jgi:hypothetical protein
VRGFHLVSRVPALSAVAVGAAPYDEQPGRGGAVELVRQRIHSPELQREIGIGRFCGPSLVPPPRLEAQAIARHEPGVGALLVTLRQAIAWDEMSGFEAGKDAPRRT